MADGGCGIEGLRATSAFAEAVARGLHSPFRLVDVGCSGGLAAGWRALGERLAAIAYDPDAEEIERLTAQEADPLVRYFAGYVGLPEGHPLRGKLGEAVYLHDWVAGRLAFERSLSLRAAREAQIEADPLDRHFSETIRTWRPAPLRSGYDLDYAGSFDAPHPQLPATSLREDGRTLFYLPNHLASLGFAEPDFLKIDVDGPDFEILRGSGGLLDRSTLLGISIEVSFVGSHDANDNSFHNVDRLMRAKGFDLFGLSVRPYASAALPSSFMNNRPGLTWQGRPLQGDALYLRDLASPGRTEVAAEASDDSLLKLATLFALFGLPDQAAELLLVHRARLESRLDIAAGLDLLALEIQEGWEGRLSYSEWIAAFEAENPSFFDGYRRREAWLEGLVARDAAERAQELRLADAETRAEAALAREAAIRSSASWRLTAPLRAFASRFHR